MRPSAQRITLEPMRRARSALLPRAAYLGLLGVAMLGCGTGAREAVKYSGDEHGPRVSPAALATSGSLPIGFEEFGQLQTSCEPWQPGTPIEGRWLADVDCTEVRLRSALRRKAASVGAELIVRERCGLVNPDPARSDGSGNALVCRAKTARRDPDARAEEPLGGDATPPANNTSDFPDAGEADWLDEPTGEQAWRIRVAYRGYASAGPPSAAPELRERPVPARLVNEWSDMPPSHQAIATVKTKCESGCSADAMRASLRVVAGRVGVGDVVGVHCVPSAAGWSCVGTLATPQVPAAPR